MGHPFESKSKIKTSKHYQEFLDAHEVHGAHMSKRAFWKQFVFPLENAITYGSWSSFARRHFTEVEKVEAPKTLVAPIAPVQKKEPAKKIEIEDNKTMDEMQDDSIRYMMQIGNATLRELTENGEVLRRVPIKERLGLFKDAMKMKNDLENLSLKKNKDERERSMFEEMMDLAQYGSVDEDEIMDGEIIDDEVAKEGAAPQPEMKAIEIQGPHIEFFSKITLEDVIGSHI